MTSNVNVAKRNLGEIVHVQVISREFDFSDELVPEKTSHFVDYLSGYAEDSVAYVVTFGNKGPMRFSKRDCLVELYPGDEY